MTVALKDVLARAGLRIDAAEFLHLVEDEARRLVPPNPEPAHFFTPAQRQALGEVGLDLSPYQEDEPDYRARSVAAQAVLAESALTVADAARLLGVDPSRVRHRLAARRLAGWKDHTGWRLPAWQFARDGVLPGLDAVLAAVPEGEPALAVAAFMSRRQDDLVLAGEPVTPREWLLAGGDPRPVAALASTLGTAF
ncbi:DNA-binding protein [Amycolatopsis alkalitolerans]|uniref:DNA-binding protein n=1 Tax=Amycolatopsis alkalitolerans TaxID=2547244 RepID=A0A5C4LVW4_9PSEU|nr:DNA-binding protein [Amycolatopsis alkalitolerans]TNC21925.1 DNA-binding protein [Amycolatopsis alkalitolerans]